MDRRCRGQSRNRGFGVKVDPDKGTVTTSIEDNPDDDATD
jgi:hypothetical protein